MSFDFKKNIKLDGHDLSDDGIVISSMVIKNWFFDMVPRMEITLTDSRDVLYNTYPIQDDAVLEIELDKNQSSEKQKETLKLKFSILNWEIIPSIAGMESGHSYIIMAYLKVDDLFYPNISKSFGKKSSTEVIEQIASDLGLTYNKKFKQSTNDNMKWLQVSMNNHDMLRYVNTRSFVNDDDITQVYINVEGELIHTTLKTEIDKDVSFVAMMSQDKQSDGKENNFDDKMSETGVEKEAPTLYYSTLSQKMFTHYNRFDTYATKMSMYGGDGKNKERVIHSFGEKLLTKYSQRSKNNAGKEVSSIEFGILNGGDFFRDGIHNDFFDAQVQYRYTLLNFFKNQVILKAKGNNLVKLWDVIDLVITKSETMQLNETVSGKYVVGGLIHILGEDSEYQTQIVLYRSGINGSELDDEIILE